MDPREIHKDSPELLGKIRKEGKGLAHSLVLWKNGAWKYLEFWGRRGPGATWIFMA
jgi:hypothetical protein